MTYGRAIRVRASGILGPVGAPFETFSFGFMVSSSNAVEQVGNTDIRDAVTGFFGRLQTQINAAAHLREVACSVVDDAATVGPTDFLELRQVGETVRHAVAVDGGYSGGPGPFHPPQVALAVSLMTAGRGAGRRGRFYLPMPAIAIGATDGLADAGALGNVAGSARQLREDLKGDGFTLSVNSRLNGLLPVTEIRVGRVLDTIRSRRNAMREAYVVAPPLSG